MVYGLRRPDPGQDRDTRSLWMVSAAGGDARELTRGPADTRAALVAGRHPTGVPAPGRRCGASPPAGHDRPRRAGATHRAAVRRRRRRRGRRTAPGSPSPHRWTPQPVPRAPEASATRTPRWSSTGSATRPTAPDCCARSARMSTCCDLADRSCRAITDGDFSAGSVAWHPDGRLLAFSADDVRRRRPHRNLRGVPRRPRRAGGRTSPDRTGRRPDRPGQLAGRRPRPARGGTPRHRGRPRRPVAARRGDRGCRRSPTCPAPWTAT